jgi:hypothetical protein
MHASTHASMHAIHMHAIHAHAIHMHAIHAHAIHAHAIHMLMHMHTCTIHMHASTSRRLTRNWRTPQGSRCLEWHALVRW